MGVLISSIHVIFGPNIPYPTPEIKVSAIFHVTCYDIFYNILSLALTRKLEKYRFQVAYCGSCLNCCYSKSDGRYQVES